MSCTQKSVLHAGARWLGIGLGTFFAGLSWYCLFNELTGAAVYSVFAIVLLLLALFCPGFMKLPVQIFMAGLDLTAMLRQKLIVPLFSFLLTLPHGFLVSLLRQLAVKTGKAGLELTGMLLQRVILLLSYFLLIVPYALFVTLFNSERLQLRKIQINRRYHSKSPGSYWIKK